MKIGKLTNEQLDKLILSKLMRTRDEVLIRPGIGIDCTAIDLGDNIAVFSSDPITAAKTGAGRLTVNVCCNDAAAAGAEPVGLMVTLLLPPSITEAEIDQLADELLAAAKCANVDIVGGHTEITDSVSRIVTCGTVIAKVQRGRVISPSGMRPGDSLIMTKSAGIEGTSIIADCCDEIINVLSAEEIKTAKSFCELTSVVPEGVFAASHGAAAMHDVTEGGILGAVWEVSHASGVGITIHKEAIPIHPITEKICRHYGIDPLRLISSGSMLISCANGEEMVAGLMRIGINAAIIGQASGGDIRFSNGEAIEPPGADELYKIL